MHMDWRKEGMADLAKQGFMRPRKKKLTTFYSVWIDDAEIGRCVCCKTTDEASANRQSRMWNGKITMSRELA